MERGPPGVVAWEAGAAPKGPPEEHAMARLFYMECIGMAAVAWGACSASAQVFTGLGNAPGGQTSEAFGVSADGSTVVGFSGVAYRWTRNGGYQLLGTLPPHTRSQGMAT